MYRIAYRCLFLIALAQISDEVPIPHGFQEFLEVHRMQIHLLFF